MFHLLIFFLWLKKHLFFQKRYSWAPWISCGPKVCWVSAVQSRDCWLLYSHVECWVQLPWRRLCGRKKTSLTWDDLVCQLPHEPVRPPLGSGTQVWELIIARWEKQQQLHNKKTPHPNKKPKKKNPIKQVNLRRVLSLDPTVPPAGVYSTVPRQLLPCCLPCRADGREEGIGLHKESDPTLHRNSTIFPYGRPKRINRANGTSRQNLKVISSAVRTGFTLLNSCSCYRTAWQWGAGSSVLSTVLAGDVPRRKRLPAA